jgi:hypothetical protein
MKCDKWKKGLLFLTIIIFFSANILPIVQGNVIIDKNKQNIVTSPSVIFKIVMLGTIYNLSYDDATHYYAFNSTNMREYAFYWDNNGDWSIQYMRLKTEGMCQFTNFSFRGILTHTFVFGCFTHI